VTRRQVAAAATRDAIVAAAARLFVQHGYDETSIARIAEEAGVAVQTIYNAVGGKGDLLAVVLRPLPDLSPEPDVIGRVVGHWRATVTLGVPGELRDYATVARVLADRGALRTGLSIDRAAATLYAVGHPDTYRALVREGEWSLDRWASWAQGALEAALLQPSAS
jgi:AcrR family transcriptional regulator